MKVIGGICDVQIDKTLSNYFKLEFEIAGLYFLLYTVANLTFVVNNICPFTLTCFSSSILRSVEFNSNSQKSYLLKKTQCVVLVINVMCSDILYPDKIRFASSVLYALGLKRCEKNFNLTLLHKLSLPLYSNSVSHI